jgi:tetratricopeptide (TPR) repeat protein
MSQEMRHQIFISYAREDTEAKERLFNIIVNRFPLKDFYPWKDSMIGAGDYRQIIEEAIQNSSSYLLLISKDFVSSNFINTVELPLILEQEKLGKKVIPIILKDFTKSELSEKLPTISELNFFPIKGENISANSNNELAWSDLTGDLLSSYLPSILKRKTFIASSAIVAIVLLTILSYYIFKPAKLCPDFSAESDVKTYIFTTQNTSKDLKQVLDHRFAQICSNYGINSDNHYYANKKILSTGEQIQKAKQCGSDLLLSGHVDEVNNEEFFEGFFHFVNDSFQIYQTQFSNDLSLQSIPIKNFVHDQQLNMSLEKVALCILGFITYKKGDYNKSIESFERFKNSTPLDPNLNSKVNTLLINAYHRMNNIDSTLAILGREEKANPNNVELVAQRAMIADDNGYSDVALNAYSELLERKVPYSNIVLEKRAKIYLKNDDYKRAKTEIEKARKLDPNSQKIKNTSIEIDSKIKANNREIKNFIDIGAVSHAKEKLDITDLFIQNGNFQQASKLIQTIKPKAIEDSIKCKSLLTELKFENTLRDTVSALRNVSNTDPSIIKANPRLLNKFKYMNIAIKK